MKNRSIMQNRHAVGARTNGFSVVGRTELSRLGVAAIELFHDKSGARHLHLAADDRENLFGVAFRTPPPDDTGLPHILEHTALCGSRHYPVKDPFVELLKSSLATFLNAFTYPDRTIYPCSTMNRRDFHNLVRVYADAVFFPLLSEDHFRQEGHHLEFLDDGGLTVKGVVYNEMRGVYSDPNGILNRHVSRELFAGNNYARDYGGDPAAIPALTYEQFVAFHRRYYHPANSWIFTYGDADLDETLALLDGEFLSKFERMEIDTAIPPLPAWNGPKSIVFRYPVDAEDDTTEKTDVAVFFATNDRRDLLATLAMRLVDGYLLDNAASPLHKALIDSRLGQEIGFAGYVDEVRDTSFGIDLKGSEADRAEKVEQLVLDVLRREIESGFDRQKVEASLHQLELSSREIKSEYPLRLMERVFDAWLYDSDPLSQINIAERLDELRRRVLHEPGFLEGVARKYLLDNPRRLLAVMIPDPSYGARTEAGQAGAMESLLAGMSEDDKRHVGETALRLNEMQSRGNTPGELATLPRLSLSDVSVEPLPLPYERHSASGVEILDVPMYSGGVGYLILSLDLGFLAEDDLDHLPLLCEALAKTGAAGRDYAEMASLEDAVTGGIEFAPWMMPHVEGPDRSRLGVTVSLKALDGKWEEALAVFADRLFRPEFNDLERLRDIVLQSRMAWRNQVVPNGNHFSSLYAARNMSAAAAAAERLSGCTQGRFVDALAADLDGKLSGLAARFSSLAEKIVLQAKASAAHVGSQKALSATAAWLGENAGRFSRAGRRPLPAHSIPAAGERTGLAAAADIAYVSRALAAPPLAGEDAPALLLLGQQLSYGYLWNEIRVKGGAYGARAAYNPGRGTFSLWSYRDPNVSNTLSAYSGLARHVESAMDLSPPALEQAVIGTVKVLDRPIRPATAAGTALTRHLGGEDDAFRKAFRERLFRLTADDVRRAAARVFANIEESPVCVLASREKLAAENAGRDGPGLRVEPLWQTGV